MSIKWFGGNQGGVRIGLEGFDELAKKLRKMEIPRNEQVKAIRPAANMVRDKARALAPAKSGALKKSIKTKVLRGNPAAIAVTGNSTLIVAPSATQLTCIWQAFRDTNGPGRSSPARECHHVADTIR